MMARQRLNDLNNEKMKTFIANALIEQARLSAKRLKPDTSNNPSTPDTTSTLDKTSSPDDPSTNRVQQFAASVNDVQLQKLEISIKF